MKKLIYVLCVGFVVTACSGETDEKKEDKKPAEDSSYNDTPDKETYKAEILAEFENLKQGKGDAKSAKSTMNKMIDFSSLFPDDENAATFLWEAHNIAYPNGMVDKSIECLDRVIKIYPSFENRDKAMFFYANHLDLDKRDTAAARVAYNMFLTQYPEADPGLKEDANFRLKNLHLSMEDIIAGKAQN